MPRTSVKQAQGRMAEWSKANHSAPIRHNYNTSAPSARYAQFPGYPICRGGVSLAIAQSTVKSRRVRLENGILLEDFCETIHTLQSAHNALMFQQNLAEGSATNRTGTLQPGFAPVGFGGPHARGPVRPSRVGVHTVPARVQAEAATTRARVVAAQDRSRSVSGSTRRPTKKARSAQGTVASTMP